MENSLTLDFINLYNHLEAVIRDEYPVPLDVGAVSWLIHNKSGFRRYKDELNYCREVRNLLQHNERLSDDYAVVPSEAMLDTLKNTVDKVERVPRARNAGTKLQDVYSVGLSDLVVPALRIMRSEAYTYIPVLEDSRVIGVFGENTILSYLFKNELLGFDGDETFEDFGDLLLLENHGADVFEFVQGNMLIFDVAELFYAYLKQAKQLGMVFVTENGKQNEKLLGVITSWDMMEYF